MISNPNYTFSGCDEPTTSDSADRIDDLNVTVVIILVDQAANLYDNGGLDDLDCLIERGEDNSELFDFPEFEELTNDTNVRRVANLLPYCPPPKCECTDLAEITVINSGNCPRNYTFYDGLGNNLFDGQITLQVNESITLENSVLLPLPELGRSYLGNYITVVTDTVDYVIDISCYPNCTEVYQKEPEYDLKRRLTGKSSRTTAEPNPEICFPNQNRLYVGQEFPELGLTITNGSYVDGVSLCDRCDCDGQINQIVFQNVDFQENDYRIFDEDGVQLYSNSVDVCESITLREGSLGDTNKLTVVTNNDFNNPETILLKCCEEPEDICYDGIMELEFEYFGDSPKECNFEGYDCDFTQNRFCKVDLSRLDDVYISCGGKKGEKDYTLDLTCKKPVCRGLEIGNLDIRVTNGLNEAYLSIPDTCSPWNYEIRDEEERRRLTEKDEKAPKECTEPIFEDKIFTDSNLQVTCPTLSGDNTQICPGLNNFTNVCDCTSGYFTDELLFSFSGVTQQITVRNEKDAVLFDDIVERNRNFRFNRNVLSQFISIEFELLDETICISSLCRVEDDNGKKRDAMYEICEDRGMSSPLRRLSGGYNYNYDDSFCCDNDLYIGKSFNNNKLVLLDAVINDQPLCQPFSICN